MKLSLYSGNLSTFYKSIYYFDGGQKFMHVSYNKWSLVCISMQLSREWSIFTELYENTLQCTITICTALIHFRNYSSFPNCCIFLQMLHPAMAKSYQSSILQLAWNTIVGFMVLNVLEVLFATRRPALPNVVPKVEKAEILFCF